MFDSNVTVELKEFESVAKRIYKNDAFGLYLANTALKHFTPYVPMAGGDLFTSVNVSPLELEYYQPYAHRLWEGKNIKISQSLHPLATKEWGDVGWENHKDEIMQTMEGYLDGK